MGHSLSTGDPPLPTLGFDQYGCYRSHMKACFVQFRKPSGICMPETYFLQIRSRFCPRVHKFCRKTAVSSDLVDRFDPNLVFKGFLAASFRLLCMFKMGLFLRVATLQKFVKIAVSSDLVDRFDPNLVFKGFFESIFQTTLCV